MMALHPDPNAPAAPTATFDDFSKLDIRVGTVLSAQAFPQARRPAYQLTIDFGGGIGVKASSAQITARYDVEALVGMQVMAVVNLAPRRIGPFLSEVLVLGCADDAGRIVLTVPGAPVPNGARLA